MNFGLVDLLYLLAAYLLGSIPFGLLLTRAAGLGDIRSIGSGNIGATNVLRTGNKALALATLLLDGAKGAAAVLIVAAITGNNALAIYCGLAAVIGHIFPIWLKFRGGKGVATTLGFFLAANWPIGVGVCMSWLIIAFIFRISSLAALVAIAAAPIYAWYLQQFGLILPAIILLVLVAYKHKENIQRLLAGTEPKIGKKA